MKVFAAESSDVDDKDTVEAEKVVGAVIVFGPPGAGKGTQAQKIAARFHIPHLSTGDMIRAEIQAGSELGKKVKEVLEAGRLVEDELVNGLVEARIQKPDCRRGFLLDGYPRTAGQAETLIGLLQRLGHSAVVIDIQISYNEVVKRITGRRLCPNCGAIYNIHSHPPKVPDVCDICKNRLVTRSDDRAEVVQERLQAYEQETLPVFEVFRSYGQKIHSVDGSLSADEVVERIFEVLQHA